ncbi:MAG: trehalose-phosphatase, partial [Acidimicrobiales bacterium]
MDPATSCVLSDFDGTLAPIVDDPRAAAALPGAIDSLHRLASRLGRVAVVSGRPVDFLVGALGIGEGRSPLDAYGLYGAEHVAADGSVTRLQP